MVDNLSKEQRQENMRRIRSKNTTPEKVVRSLLHKLGFRFRLHRNEMPGKPDIVLPKYKTAIFVHGCFWHRHTGCKRATFPKSNVEYWLEKFKKNVRRDKRNRMDLENTGWKFVLIWECEIKDIEKLKRKLIKSILRDAH